MNRACLVDRAGSCLAVIADACGSPPPNHQDGIERLRDAGLADHPPAGLTL
ncbi:MAG: hypothetical protein JNM20_13095 [Rhizobiales bacterium]|nr:hypothetical protein [Hyphomicrobiales bacterium]